MLWRVLRNSRLCLRLGGVSELGMGFEGGREMDGLPVKSLRPAMLKTRAMLTMQQLGGSYFSIGMRYSRKGKGVRTVGRVRICRKQQFSVCLAIEASTQFELEVKGW